jgi:predicted DNA-binding protein
MADLTITVRLPEEKVRRLRQMASRDRRTLTDVIEESLDAAIEQDHADAISNLERLSYVVGRCASGGNDVTKMDLGEIMEELRRGDRVL